MLACTQDLFFNNDKPSARQDLIPTNLQQQSPMSSISFNQQQPKFTKKSSHIIAHHISEKDKEEQVWPPEVESAFIEALESIPKLGRRKILVNGKPCGRNELISDFIFRKTSKVRTRKQVSSHIQVLKNTRKNDPHFMRLLTDAVDLEDDFVHRRTPKPAPGKRAPPPQSSSSSSSSSATSSLKQEPPFFNHNNNSNATSNIPPLPLRKLTNLNSAASISSDESSIHSSPSPADYVFDMMYIDEHALSMFDMKDPFYDSIHSSFFDPNLGMTTPSSQPSFSFATASSSSATPYSLMHPPSSTSMTTPSLVESVCFDLSPMETATCAPLMPSNDMYGVQVESNEKGRPISQPQQQQQQLQVSHLTHQQQFMHPSFHHSAQPFHTNEAMVEPLRSSTQSRKWKRGNRRQKYVNTQHSRKGYQHHAVHRHTPFMNQHKSDDSPTMTTTSCDAAVSASAGTAIDMPMNPMTSSNTIPMTAIPSPSSDVTLWPNYLCFYLEYASPDATLDSPLANSHTLAQLPHCFPNVVFSNDDLCHGTTLKERYDTLLQLNPSLALIPSDITLFAKMKLDLNYNMNDFYFNNTCFFESKDRRMIECTTTIYSFGNIVLESKEMQQALWTPDNKYMYSFAFVNQFFDAFMKGVKSLQSWEEVDIAIHNLCIVQVFEDMETKCQLLDNNNSNSSSSHQSLSTTASPISPSYAYNSTSSATLFDNSNGITSLKPNHMNSTNNNGGHLLALIFEFERGQGAIDMTMLHHQQNNDTMNDSTCLMD